MRRSVISDDYIVFIGEDCTESIDDPITFEEAVNGSRGEEWLAAMRDKMESMAYNGVWELAELPYGQKAVGCKWVLKTKKDAKGNIEGHKARLVAKGFTQRAGVDYTETFSPVSSKDAFKIMIALVVHFDLELHQMDVKTTFLNGNLSENVYMEQPEGFV